MIFDIVQYIIMEWTMPNESQICRICMRVLILKKKRRRVLLASLPQVKYKSETYCWTQKLNREDYGVDKYWGLCFFSRLRFAYVDRPGTNVQILMHQAPYTEALDLSARLEQQALAPPPLSKQALSLLALLVQTCTQDTEALDFLTHADVCRLSRK